MLYVVEPCPIVYCAGVPTRLSGGASLYQGVVEIYYRGNWLPLCFDDGYGLSVESINVICGPIRNSTYDIV